MWRSEHVVLVCDMHDCLLYTGSEDDIKVQELLLPLTKEEIRQLFRILGLSSTRVENKYDDTLTAYRNDLIRSWIQEDDKVMDKGGATWKNLQDSLRSMGKTGIANNIYLM